MKIFLKFKIAFFLFFIISCSPNESKKNKKIKEQIQLDVSKMDVTELISTDILDSISLIPLETNERTLINKIKKISIHQNKMFILDPSGLQGVLVFDKNGKYLNKIGNIGKGEGEFINAKDFAINKKKNEIFIWDNQQRKMVIFDVITGLFLKEFSIKIGAYNFEIVDDNKIVFFIKSPAEKHSIALYDIQNRNIQYFLEKSLYDTNISFYTCLFSSEKTLYSPFLNNTVYKIENDNIIPFINFDFGNYKVAEKELLYAKSLGYKELSELIRSGKWIYGIENILLENKVLTFNLVIRNSHLKVIHFLDKDRTFYGNRYGGNLKRLGLIKNLTCNNGYFYSVVDSRGLINFEDRILKNIDPNLRNKLIYTTSIDSININSNPIVLKIKYKL